MNANCYKTVFSKRLGALVAVGEHATSQGKATGSFQGAGFSESCSSAAAYFIGALSLSFALVAMAYAAPASNALPTGGQVAQGAAAISQSGASMAIQQSTARAVVNWQSFDIGKDAKVNIVQPSSQSVLLNRVSGPAPSQIFGQMTANGQVVLVNPNGVTFGKDGSVSAAGLTASTLNTTDADFMAGRNRFTRDGATGQVLNLGNLTVAPGGYVALLGASVSNEGKIVAPQGNVALGAAESITLPVYGSRRIKMELTPSAINAAVANQRGGSIVTEGGQVYMQAAAVGSAIASVMQSGSIDTSGAQGGAVHLLTDGGHIKVDGSITANSTQGAAGGDIYIGRDKDTNVLAKTADVSGALLESKGGFVETSGDYLKVDGISVKAKDWLLDPSDITISSSANSNVTGTSPADITPNGASGTSSVVNVSTIQNAINTGTNVTIKTTNALNTTGAGNITIANALTFNNQGTTDATLNLIADNGITQNAGASITTNAASAKLVNVNMTANGNYQGNTAADASSQGIVLNSSINTNGAVTLTGTNKNIAAGAGVQFGSGASITTKGAVTVTGVSTSGTGYGVALNNTLIDAGTTGDIWITGTSTGNHGVFNNFTNSSVYNMKLLGKNVSINGSTSGTNSSGFFSYIGNFAGNIISAAENLSITGTVNGAGFGTAIDHVATSWHNRVNAYTAGGTLSITGTNNASAPNTGTTITMAGVQAKAGGDLTVSATTNNAATDAISVKSSFYYPGYGYIGGASSFESTGGNTTLKSNQGSILIQDGVPNSVTSTAIKGKNVIIDNTGGTFTGGVFTAGTGVSTSTVRAGVQISDGLQATDPNIASNPTLRTITATDASGQIVLSGKKASTGSGVEISSAAALSAANITILGENTGATGAAINISSAAAKLTSTQATTLTAGGTGSGTSLVAAGNIQVGTQLKVTTPAAGTISGLISGTGSLLKSGAGQLTLSAYNASTGVYGTNTFSGGATVSQGTLVLGHGNGNYNKTAGTGGIIVGDLNTGNNNVSLLVEKGTPGNATGYLNRDITFTNNGTGMATLGTTSGTVNEAGRGWTTVNSKITLNRDVVINDATNDRLTMDGQITGTGNITFTGNRITMGAVSGTGISANNFVGNVTISSGTTLQASAKYILPTTTNVINNGTLRLLDGKHQSIDGLSGSGKVETNSTSGGLLTTLSLGNNNSSATYTGTIVGTSSPLNLVKNGTGTQVLSGNNTYTGGTNVAKGTLQIGDGTNNGLIGAGAVDIATGTTLDFNVKSGSLVGYTTYNTFTGEGTLKKTGTGTLAWSSGGATFSLGTNSKIDVREGTFTGASSTNEVWKDNKASLNVESGATFLGVEGNIKVDALTGGGVVSSGWGGIAYGFTVGVNGGSGTFAGSIQDANGVAAKLTKEGTGTQILTGNNTYTGITTVDGGTLQIGDGGTTGTLGNGGAVNLQGGSNLHFNRSAATTINNDITGTGNVSATITGASGSLTLAKNITLTGTVSATADQAITTTASKTISTRGGISLTGKAGVALNGDITNSTSGAITIAAGDGTVLSAAAITSASGATITQRANAAVTLTTDGQGDLTVAKIVKGVATAGTGAGDITVAAGIKVPAGATGGNIKTVAGNTITNNGTGKTLIYTGSALNSGQMSNLMSSLSNLQLTGSSKNTAVRTAYGAGGGFAGGPNTQVLFRESVDLTGSLTSATINTTYGDAAPTSTAIASAIVAANGGTGNNIVTNLAAGTFKAAVDDVATDLANNATLVATANSFGRLDANAAGYNYNESASANYAASGASVVKLVVAKANLTKVEGAKTYDGQIQTLVAGTNGSLTLTGVASETAALNTGNSVNLTGANAGTQAVSGLGTNAAFTSANGLSLANYNVADTDMSALASALPTKNTVAIAKAKLTEVTGAKIYDGNTNLSGGTLSIKGVNGEKFTTDKASVVLGSKNVVGTDGFGANSVTNLSGLTLTGTTSAALSTNYDQTQLPTTSNTVTIGKANLAVAMSNQTKVYDGTVTATLTAGAITATGVTVGSVTETATVSQTSGTYNDKNVNGATTVTANLLPVDFASGTADLSNYNLPFTVSNTSSNITKKDVTYSGVGVVAKTYDGTTTAVLNGAAALGSVAAGSSVSTDTKVITTDAVTLGGTVAGTFASKNVRGTNGTGANTVTLTGASLSGADASNYNLVQQAPVTANDTISKANLAVTMSSQNKTYDGTTAAALATGAITATGVIVGGVAETATVSKASGTYNSKNVATATTVTASLATGDFTAATGTDLSNYNLPTTVSNTTSTIGKANLAVAMSSQNKTYDGTTAAALATGAITATGVTVDGVAETATVSKASGTYNSKNVATATTVTASLATGDFTAATGTDLSNYNLPTTVSNTTSTIGKANLAVAMSSQNKTYDGTTAAALATGAITATGVTVGGVAETATVSKASGTYNSKNVATATTVTASLATGDFTAATGTDLSNYNLPTTVSNTTSTIGKANLAVAMSSQNKTYDGTTAAALATGAITATGVTVGGVAETATVSKASGTYNSKNVATATTVTASLATGDFTAATGTDLSNYNLPTTVSNTTSTIGKANLAVAMSSQNKTYDGTTAAALATGAITATGVTVDGVAETATVSKASGTYNSKNVATATTVTASLATGDFTAATGTDLSNYNLPTTVSNTTSTIGKANLAVAMSSQNKTYDGTTAAALATGAITATGVTVGGVAETATVSKASGTYNSKNVATATTVTASLATGDFTAATGTDLSNYNLPTTVSNTTSTIGKANLAVAMSSQNKTYDGTTAAALATGAITATGVTVGGVAETATVSKASGTYNSKNVATATTVTASLATGDFTAATGTDLSNYNLPTTVSNTTSTIGKANLAVAMSSQNKTYDGTTAAALATGAITATGVTVGGVAETATVSKASGTYNSKNVATATTVTASLATGDFTAATGTDLSNYNLPTTVSNTTSTIGKANLAVAMSSQNKTYDGTTAAALATGAITATGVTVDGVAETATVSKASGTYNSKNVATATTVTASLATGDFTAATGTDLSNYNLPTTVSNTTSTIGKANLAVAMSSQNKTYDGTTAAALATGAITATGVTVDGVAETATVSKASGTYNSKNVATATTVTASLATGDFTAATGTDLSNYNLPTTVSNTTSTIGKANLAVAMSSQNKTYDGTTAAALATGAITATGVTVDGVAETATVSKASGTYNSKNVATATTVTASLATGDFTAATGTDLSNYNLPTTVSNTTSTIGKANLAVAMSSQNKTYDGTTAAALATGAITATGVTVDGVAETATVNKASGTYNSKNVNAATTVTATLVATDFAAGTADLSNYNLPTTVSTVVGGGTISKANLAVAMSNQNKTYDGTTAAALATGAITATGVTVGGVAETATVNKASGTYNSKNVNAATTVTATLVATDFAAGTADLSNYNLPTTVSTVVGGGTISKANLAVAMSNQNKTYDGTTAAALATGAITATGVTVGGVAETATVNKASGTYNDKNVNAATTVTATLVATDFAAGTADLSNYNLPTTVSTVVGGGTISKANLAVAMSNQNKTYDGTTAAALATGAITATGVTVGGVAETATVNKASGTYNSKNVNAATTVTATLVATDFAAGTADLSNYNLPTTVSTVVGGGTISKANLAVAMSNQNKTYDGTTAAALATGAITATGVTVGGVAETATVNKASGTYNSKNVNAATTVTATLVATDFAAGTADLSNYNLPTTVSTVVGGGTISKANLAVAMSNQNKTYDGTTAAALATGAITATGVTVGGVAETATVNKASGTYNSKNVNAATTVTATLVATDFAAGTADLSNYNLPTTVSTVVGGGTISKANLAVAMSNQNKTYDGTTAAALATGAITATGVTVGGVAETATVNKASGTYNSKNVNAATTVTATLVATDFAAGTADLSNYNLPTTVSTVVGGGTISKANLAVAMSNQNKTYDGTTAAALATGAITATGVTVGGVAETATVNKASGTYNSKNVNAATTVTATLVATDFAAGTADLSNYNLPTTVSTVVGGGTISKANLAVAMSNQNKTYDGTTAAALATGAITATGVTVGGVAETATVNKASGTYNSKNVNAATTVTATLVATDFAAGTADLSNYNLPTTVSTVVGGGTISKANLAVAMSNQNKTYDGTTAAALAAGAITATGVTVGGVAETATVNKASGTYNSKNVNAATTVTATLVATDFAAGTADLSNYNLPTTVSTVVGGGTISKANLAVAMSNQNKTYDGTTAAALATGAITATGVTVGGVAETATVNKASGTYNSKNVNAATTVTATLVATDFAAGTADLSNYNLPTTVAGNGAISKSSNTVTLTANSDNSKVYNGTTQSVSGFGVTGLLGDDAINSAAAVAGITAGASGKNAGSYTSTFTGSNADLANNYANITKTNGTLNIAKANLTVTLSDQTKTYDGSTAATLVPTAFTVKGVTVAGQTETASVNQTVALYNDKNVLGASSVTANLGAGNFAAASGTDLNNYNLPTSLTGKGTITPKDAAVTGNATTVQANGTQQTQSPATKSGFVAGEDVTVSGLATGLIAGTYNSNLSAAPANAATVLSNYKIAYTNAALRITPAVVTNSTVAVALARTTTPTSRLNLSGFSNAGGVGAAVAGAVDSGADSREPSGAAASPPQACSPENLQQCECEESAGDGIELCLAPSAKL